MHKPPSFSALITIKASTFGLITAIFFLTFPAHAIDIYVNQKGNDSWTGFQKDLNQSTDAGPFRTLERAQQAVRALKKTNKLNEPVNIHIGDGLYFLERPLIFNQTDSGLPDREITWQAEAGAKVTVSGGIPINCSPTESNSNWNCILTDTPNNIEPVDTNRIKGNAPTFDLFVNNQRMTLARWPNQDWAHIKYPLDERSRFTSMETFPALDNQIDGAQVHIFPGNDWFDQYVGVVKIDSGQSAIQVDTPTQYKLQTGRRFYIRNLRSLLDAPGEWFYSKPSHQIVFNPFDQNTVTSAILSSLPNILIADGSSFINFKNIAFRHSAGSALLLRNTSNVKLEALEVANIGNVGVEIRGGKNVSLINSTIYDTGKHGAIVSGGDRIKLEASGHRLENNHFHDTGVSILTYSSAISINGVGAIITHNLLEQGTGTAILINGNNHLIEKNEVHHFCLEAADCGALYTGRDWAGRGNIIRNNYIHDIIGYGLQSVDATKNQVVYHSPDYAMGIYLDDGASGFDISANILKNAGATSLYIHGGRDNHFYNNYIITDRSAIWVSKILTPNYDWNQNQERLDNSPYRSEIWQKKYPNLALPMLNKTWPEGNQIDHNVIISENPNNSLFRYWLPKSSSALENNIIWSATNQIILDYNITEQNVRHQTASWQQWIAEGVEKNSLFINPCIDLIGKSLIACKDSPIFDKHIPLPQSDIGLNR